MRARTGDVPTCCVGACVRACGCAFRRTLIRAEPYEPCPSARTACGFGSQAFLLASAFNANIGAWNTARVTDLASVCAAFRPGGAPPAASRTRSAGASMRRGRLCAAAPPMRGRVRTWRHSVARGHVWRYGCAEERFAICSRMHTCICKCCRRSDLYTRV
jgi:hypothetical protein